MNNNSARRITYADVELVDTAAVDGLRPSHPVQSAQDAIVSIDGVLVQRDSNQIEDAIRGVTLNIKNRSEEGVPLSIDYDYEKITGRIVGLIEKYNDLLEFVNTQTKVVPGAGLEEKTEAGVMTGDITIMGFKGKLQRIMMDPHPTDGGRSLSLLAQIGISTSGGSFQSSGTVDMTRLRGYLQIDEAKLEESVTRMGDWVKQLFGYDSDNDLTVDTGAAFQVDTYLRAYVETGGIVATRTAGLDNSIASKEREIERYNEHLEDYEAELRRKFGAMEGALDNLEKSSRAIENLNRRND